MTLYLVKSFITLPLSIQGSILSQLFFFLAGMISAGGLFLAIRFIRGRNFISLSKISPSILDENLPDSVYIKDKSGKYILANQNFMQLLKSETSDSILGRTDTEIYKSIAADKYTREDQKLLNGEITVASKVGYGTIFTIYFKEILISI